MLYKDGGLPKRSPATVTACGSSPGARAAAQPLPQARHTERCVFVPLQQQQFLLPASLPLPTLLRAVHSVPLP